MDAAVENNDEEPFLKIDRIWSESEENFDKISIKEEIQSDDESKLNFNTFENGISDEEQENSSCKTPEEDEPLQSEFAKSYALLWQEKNNMKSKDQNDESELRSSRKFGCTHDMKKFKLVKKRLRCSDCQSIVCPECCKIFPVLQNHLTGNDLVNPGFYTCKSCPLAFQSLCALQAHVRIHTFESPYVCPDCGVIYNNVYFLILHIITKCCHVFKVVRYKCKNCPDDNFTPFKFLHHIKEKHIVKMIRCSFCSLMFDDEDEFASHLDSFHIRYKIDRLNHYSCSLCSDMLIPEAMYQEHIDHHYNTPYAYDINYECFCGKIYRLISLFRNHITLCPKKGVLPWYWGFLQSHAGPPGAIRMEFAQDGQDEKNEDEVMFKRRSSNSLLTLENNDDLIDFSQEDSEKTSDGSTSTNVKSTTVSINPSHLKCPNSISTTNNSMDEQEVEILNSQSKESDSQDSVQEGGTTLVGERPSVNNSEKSHSQTKEKNGNAETSRMGYDHIPCDHLGYLRVQSSDLDKKDNDEGTMASSSSNEFQTVTELDERTGLIRTRKIPIETIYEDETDCKDDSSEDSSDSNNSPREMFSGDKVKVKVGTNAYFMCPFCVVLFPKGISAFQQFRLHIECYHSNAALNITVNQSESDKPENHCETIKERGRSSVRNKLNSIGDSSSNKEHPSFFESSSFKVVATKTYRRKITEGDKRVESNSNTSNRETRLENGNEDSVNHDAEIKEIAIKDSDVNEENELPNEEKKENGSKESDKSFKEPDQSKGKDLCWSMKLSVQSDESLSHENTTTTLDAEEKSAGDDSTSGTVNKSETKGANPDNSDLTKKKENEDETPKPTPETNEKDSKKVIVREKPRILAPIQGRSCIVLLEKKDADQYTSTLINRNRDTTNEQRVLGKSHSSKTNPVQDDKQNKKNLEPLIEVPSDYDEEFENSKDSNWSVESSTGFLSESKASDCPEGTSAKTRPSERSRRESEVWSEFYESLKLAERLKKSRKRKASCQFENDKNCVALPDYSSKRIVKKPKRYRQSSDSQDSLGEYGFSESEDELDFTDKSAPDINTQGLDEREKLNAELRLEKKQKLLNKIESFDPKVVDYLFDLLNRSEKFYGPFKKHSSLEASRYGEDLRSYRKKVLKGIKNRSRSYNVLRYQDIMKKKSLGEDVGDQTEILEEGSGQGTRMKTPSPTDSKSGEKKRGRPRKLNTKKLNERRRSDKEVDFIEKNFEMEGGEGSLNKRKRKLSTKLQYYKTSHGSEDKDEFSSGQVISNKSGDVNRKFTCAVCKDVFPDNKVFREHIVIHRMEEGTYQCMECGECFVVRPSLEKHLHAFHKIRNTDKYITENDCWNIKKDAPEGDDEPLKENQCKVCKDQFDRAVDLTKHFRIHGMAFLKEFRKDSKAK